MVSSDSPLLSIALLSPPFSILSYLPPKGLPQESVPPGTRVLVPMGRSIRMGVALGECGEKERKRLPEKVRLKHVLWPLEPCRSGVPPLITGLLLETLTELARRQASSVGRVLSAVLPADLRSADVRFQIYGDGVPRQMTAQDIAAASTEHRRELALAWQEGQMRTLIRPGRLQEEECVSLAHDPPWAVRPAARRQLAVLELLWERGAMSRKDLTSQLGPGTAQVVNTLASHGLVSIGPMRDPFEAAVCAMDGREAGTGGYRDITPTEEQATSLARLEEMLGSASFACALIHGVTGSGKTYLYLRLILECLRQGRSAFLLAPEVALACQLRNNVSDFLAEYASETPEGAEVVFHHGYQPQAQRAETFLRLGAHGGPVVVVGTRSSLFLPAPNPGLIILDEEHDGSFKQGERLIYQAKEVAFHMMTRADGLLVLGSATPDVKSYHAARNRQVELLALHDRVGRGRLPDIDIVDIRHLGPTDHILAEASMQALRETVDRGQQAVVMLNRRGYSPNMYCLDCGQTLTCPECDIGLTYHKKLERLLCHYCGLSLHFPLTCGSCGGDSFLPMGEGTEKIEETLSAVLPPEAKALRLDRDTTRRPGMVEDILAAFAREEAQVLVGTQMLSKGHHFPKVTLAIAADADLGLNLPDYRASERTFQLLVQMAGRAGRGSDPGRVLIQTRDPANPCWRFVRENDYLGFFHNEIEKRSRMQYPPFTRLALVRMDFPMDWEQGARLADMAATEGRRTGMLHKVFVLGPAPAPLGLLRGRRRIHCLLKGEHWQGIRTVYRAMLGVLPDRSHFRTSLDLDPVDML